MPVTKSAKKKLRKDIKRSKENKKIEESLRKALKTTKKNLSSKNLQETTKLIDKAAKKHIIHSNKAARIKSKLSKLTGIKTPKTKASKSPKK